MSFLSSVIIGAIEKELTAQAPEVAQYTLQLVGTLAADLISYVEKKVSAPSQSPQMPSQE